MSDFKNTEYQKSMVDLGIFPYAKLYVYLIELTWVIAAKYNDSFIFSWIVHSSEVEGNDEVISSIIPAKSKLTLSTVPAKFNQGRRGINEAYLVKGKEKFSSSPIITSEEGTNNSLRGLAR